MTLRRVQYLLILLFLSGLTAAFAQDGTANIRTVLGDQVKEWNNGSVEGYMKGYWNSDSTMFVSGGKVTRGYREVLARYRKSYDTREKMGKLDFSELVIRKVSSDVAIATGAWQLTRTNDKLGGRFTLIIEKKPAGWRIVYDHTSSAK